MSEIKTALDNARKAELSYTDLNKDLTATQYVARLRGIKNNDKLTGGKYDGDGIENITLDQAKAFAGVTEQRDENNQIVRDPKTKEIQYQFKTKKVTQEDGTIKDVRTSGYSIQASSSDYNIGNLSGFDAVLLKNNETGELTLSFRGSELTSPMDILADIQLGKDGTAYFQEISMNNFYDKLIEEGVITSSDKLTVTGHSLGGFLAQKFTIDHPDVVDHTYTYSAPGIGGLASEILQLLGVLPENIPHDKITNITTDGFISLFEDWGINIGSKDVEIGGGNSHSISTIVSVLQSVLDGGILTFNDLQKYLQNKGHLTTQDRTNLAQMINAGGLPWNYNSQQAQQIIIDPLALDLNHNGKIDTINANSSNTFFDMDNNGMSEITGWIDKEDGLLVYDKNNNGKIDNINELFGNKNKDGYRELRELINSNGDNVIDKNDTKFKDLKIWQDLNGDGISQSNELKTLDELNITSINLNSKNTNIDDNGNNIFKTSTFTQNGQEYLSGDVNFAVDKRFTDFRGDYTLSVDALFLPWLRGYGDVKDAHIAYSMDEEFKEFTKTLVGDDEKAYNEFDTYLKKWSGLDKVHSANGITRDTLTMDDKVWIMETLSGEDFFKSRIETAYSNNRNSSNRYDCNYINEQYKSMKIRNYSIFASQSFYKDGFNGSYYSVNQDKMVVYDKELLNNSIVEFINSSSNIKDAMGFVFALDKLKNDLDINIADLTNNITNNKEMVANVLNDTANLSVFQNSFHGSSGDDIVFGTDGDDILHGEHGNDILNGGTGDDTLNGGYGSDTYIFNLGDGNDTISEDERYWVNDNDIDKIIFGEGIDKDDITLTKHNNDILLTINENDSIVIKNWFKSSHYQIENFEFADGTILSKSEFEGRGVVVEGTNDNDNLSGSNSSDIITGKDGDDTINGNSGDDTIDGGNGNDTIDGGNGNDTIDGGTGDDTINGGYGNDTITGGTGNDTINGNYGDDKLVGNSGNDTLNSGSGNDILNGGTGDDTLNGGYGSDTYIFNLGDGNDTISEDERYWVNDNDIDKIIFGEGIDKDDITLTKHNNDILLTINENDSIVIKNWFKSTRYQIENFEFADGTILSKSEFEGRGVVVEGTNDNDNLSGSNSSDIITGKDGDDTINGNSGDDTIDGGNGNDTIDGGNGNDTIDGGTGDDTINGGYGNDTITGGTGNDTINGNYGDDKLVGNSGNDTLNSGSGNDILNGGTGDDTLNGGYGSDTYIFNLGDGNDTISEDERYWVNDNDIDKIIFGEGIDKDDITLTKHNNDILLTINENDSIVIKNWFKSSHYQIENFEFADGTILSKSEFEGRGVVVEGTNDNDNLSGSNSSDIITGKDGDDTINGNSGDDTIDGGNGNDTIDGGNGNDTIDGGTGDDTINGGYGNDTITGGTGNDTINGNYGDDKLVGNSGNDTLNSGSGNDILNGGTGDDTLNGGYGSDTYIFNLGDGNDTISEDERYWVNDNDIDKIIFGEGIDKDNITLTKHNNDILLTINENDSIVIKNWFKSSHYQIENFEFADGTILSKSEFEGRGVVVEGTNDNDNLSGSNSSDIITGKDGDDTINGNSGDDTIDGGNGNDTIDGGNGNDTIDGGTGDDTINGGYGNDTITGGTGNDTINGNYGDDKLVGNSGNDTLNSGSGNDILNGGTGDDTLNGGYGSDTYIFNLGDGNDTISEDERYWVNDNDIDKIIFGEGIDKDNITLTKHNNDILLTINENDSIVIKNWFKSSHYQIENFEFADGTILSKSEFEGRGVVVEGTNDNDNLSGSYSSDIITGKDGDDTINGNSGDDTIDGGNGNDTIDGGNGNDTIDGGTGDDTINGGYGNDTITGGTGNDTINGNYGDDKLVGNSGNDTLNSGSGNDILNGGTGDDTLNGGYGSDTYIFNLGDGNDTISEDERYWVNDNDIDKIIFGEGIDKDNITLTKHNNDILLTINENDSIVIKNWFKSSHYQIENFEFADGTILSKSEFEGRGVVVEGTNDNDNLSGSNSSDIITGKDGDDTINGNSGDDTIDGGNGNDTIDGGNGNDTIDGGTGDDTINGGYGNDTITGGTGNDTINGNYGDDKLVGNSGNDTLNSGSGNDILNGGTGDDTLNGGYGSDTYIFNLGDGNDTISEDERYWVNDNDIDKIIFGEGIDKDDITLTKHNNDILLTINENDSIVIKNWFKSSDYQIENFEFADGTILSKSEFEGRGVVVEGTNDNDNLSGSNSSDIITGKDGDDIINGNSGNDRLYGGNGNDILNGGYGDDTLDGGEGNDTLNGSYGNDIYSINLNGANDTIIDSGGDDILLFGENINKEDVIFKFNNDDLQISYSNNDMVTILNQKNSSNTIEKIELADGNYLTNNDINLLIQNINAYAADNGIDISSNENIKQNEQLMNIVASSWHQ